jgi:hypothetical protein
MNYNFISFFLIQLYTNKQDKSTTSLSTYPKQPVIFMSYKKINSSSILIWISLVKESFFLWHKDNSICPYPQKNKKQFIHFKNAKEREPKEINTSKLKQVFALIFITSVPNLNIYQYSKFRCNNLTSGMKINTRPKKSTNWYNLSVTDVEIYGWIY